MIKDLLDVKTPDYKHTGGYAPVTDATTTDATFTDFFNGLESFYGG